MAVQEGCWTEQEEASGAVMGQWIRKLILPTQLLWQISAWYQYLRDRLDPDRKMLLRNCLDYPRPIYLHHLHGRQYHFHTLLWWCVWQSDEPFEHFQDSRLFKSEVSSEFGLSHWESHQFGTGYLQVPSPWDCYLHTSQICWSLLSSLRKGISIVEDYFCEYEKASPNAQEYGSLCILFKLSGS